MHFRDPRVRAPTHVWLGARAAQEPDPRIQPNSWGTSVARALLCREQRTPLNTAMPSSKTLVALATFSLAAACTRAPMAREAPPTARLAEAYDAPPSAPKLDARSLPAGASDVETAAAKPRSPETPHPAPTSPDGAQLPDERALDDMGGIELAQMLASKALADELPNGDGLPRPRSASDNNPFALVRSSSDMAKDTAQIVTSHDGKRLAYLVSRGGVLRSLWVANRDGTEAREVVSLDGSVATLPEGDKGTIPSEALFSPSFSADDKSVYFQADGWATSMALYSVDLKSGAVRFVSDANGYEVIGQCRDKSLVGSIIAYRHSYSELPLGAVDWFFLLGQSGKAQGALGPTEENVERFLHNRCGDAQRAAVPALLKQRPGCNDFVMVYKPKRFLDGTELPLFFSVPADKANRPFESLDVEDVGLAFDVDEAKSILLDQCGIEVPNAGT